MSDTPIFDPNDPSLIDNQFGVPGIDNSQIAQQVAQAMAGLGKRASFDGLGNDQMGRQVFDPSNPNAANQMMMGQVPQTQPAPGTPPPQPATPPPPPAPTQQPATTLAQQTPNAPEGVDEALWAQWLAEQPDETPDTTSAPAPTPAAAQPSVQGQPTQESTETPASGIDIELGGQKYHLDADQVTYLLQVNSWLEQQPDEVKRQWASIQSGEAVAMSRAELQRLQQAQQFQQQTPATQAAQLQQEPDLELLDDETANYIRGLQQRLAQQPVAPTPSPDTPPFQPAPGTAQDPASLVDPNAMYQAAAHQAQRDLQNRQVVDSVVDQYRQQYNLDDGQVEHLTRVVAQSQMVPVLANRYAVRSPLDNSVIQDAPFDRVVSEAFSMAMATDPTLSEIHNDYTFNQRLAAQNAANQRVATKRGKAGSLASAPSAAVPAGNAQGLPPIGPGNQMNLPAMTAAIANAIEQAQTAG